MQNTLISKLIRIAQIADELEDIVPEAAQEINGAIEEEADLFGGGKADIDPSLFPKVKNPTFTGMDDSQGVNNRLMDDIDQSRGGIEDMELDIDPILEAKINKILQDTLNEPLNDFS